MKMPYIRIILNRFVLGISLQSENVDKTGLIALINKIVGTDKKAIKN